ncbi:MAG: hypothetical protein ACKVRN_07035 [Pyrinomonadaceae bacterium]
MKVFVLALLIAATMCISVAAQSKSGIQGVWKLTEVTTTGPEGKTMKATQPGMYLFTKTHYSIINVVGDKPREVMEDYSKATQEQLLSIFVNGFRANAGTYEVKGGKLTVRPMVAKSPGYMMEGTWDTSAMKIDGNMMTLTSEVSNSGPAKNPTTFKLTRVE